MNKNIRMDYRGWKFRDKVPLIPRDRQWKKYFDYQFENIDVDVHVDVDLDSIKDAVEDTINESMNEGFESLNFDEKLDEKLCGVHRHIEEAKEHLCCDICCSKNDIKRHIDNKFDTINFEEQFSNLNEQAQTIIQKLDTIINN